MVTISCGTLPREKKYIMFASILPTLYIWSLPLLQLSGFTEDGDQGGQVTISKYISNSHATGLMASVFYYPCLIMWEYPQHKSYNWYKSCQFYSLLVFQLSFGLFLTFTTTWKPLLHSISVAIFSIAAITHFGLLLKKGHHQEKLKYLLVGGILGFLILCLFTILANYQITVSYAFWFFECVCLTIMIWFTPLEILYHYKQHNAPIKLSISNNEIASV